MEYLRYNYIQFHRKNRYYLKKNYDNCNVLLHKILEPYIFEKITAFLLKLPFHRIFCEIVITALNFKNRWILKFEITPIVCRITKDFILDNFSLKKRKYWCLDFTDCTYLFLHIWEHIWGRIHGFLLPKSLVNQMK